jgi:hypothetical protein
MRLARLFGNANSSVFVANKAKNADLIVALQPSISGLTNTALIWTWSC